MQATNTVLKNVRIWNGDPAQVVAASEKAGCVFRDMVEMGRARILYFVDPRNTEFSVDCIVDSTSMEDKGCSFRQELIRSVA